jgi:hypothetical protein
VFVAALTRGACLARCPEYEARLFSDGYVEFEGLKNTTVHGRATGNVPKGRVEEVRAALKLAGVGGMLPEYARPEVTDQPTVTVRFVEDGVERTVRHMTGDMNAPETLLILENHLDQLLETERWVKPPTR